MKKLKSINSYFWRDPYIQGLKKDEKLLYAYFLSNPECNLAGIYEISLKTITFESGITKSKVTAILQKFQSDKKILYKDNYIIIRNYTKNQKYNPNMIKNVKEIIENLPDEVKGTIKKFNYEILENLINEKTTKESISDIQEHFQTFWECYPWGKGTYPENSDYEKTKKIFASLNGDLKDFFAALENYKDIIKSPKTKWIYKPKDFINHYKNYL